MTRYAQRCLIVAVATVVVAGCGGDSSETCVSSGLGEVCAQGGNGSIEFSGSGLLPNSQVVIVNSEIGQAVYPVDSDGSLQTDGGGVLSVLADTEFTFEVTAVDSDTNTFGGDLTTST